MSRERQRHHYPLDRARLRLFEQLVELCSFTGSDCYLGLPTLLRSAPYFVGWIIGLSNRIFSFGSWANRLIRGAHKLREKSPRGLKEDQQQDERRWRSASINRRSAKRRRRVKSRFFTTGRSPSLFVSFFFFDLQSHWHPSQLRPDQTLPGSLSRPPSAAKFCAITAFLSAIHRIIMKSS